MPTYTLQAGRGILKDGRHLGSIMRAGPTTNPCEVDQLARDAVHALNKHDQLEAALSSLLAVLLDKNACGTNVDGRWMGVPDWEIVDAAVAALKKGESQ